MEYLDLNFVKHETQFFCLERVSFVFCLLNENENNGICLSKYTEDQNGSRTEQVPFFASTI